HTLMAIRELDWPQASVVLVDADEDQARRIVVVDNRTSDLAANDVEQLAAMLSEFEDLAGTGYDEGALDDLLDDVAPGLPPEADEIPPLPEEPRTRAGDLWRLGAHRLVCGDARDPSVYTVLLDGRLAELVITDPPYGVAY